LFFYKSILKFVENLLDYRVQHNKSSIEKCNLIIKNIKLIGMTAYGDELINFLKMTKK